MPTGDAATSRKWLTVNGAASVKGVVDQLSDRTNCVFCDIAAGRAPGSVVREWRDTVAIRPRGGVSPGHVLVIPRIHVADASVDPQVAARTMECAAELMSEFPAANIITSRGAAATQTVFHLHIHVVPRERGDGLLLPWTPRNAETEGGDW